MLIFFAFLVLTPTRSYAWTCALSLEPKDLFKRNDSVFIGKAVESSFEDVGTLSPKSRTTFEVKSSFKGSIEDKITIVTTAGSVFLEGKEYLVYAYKTTEDNYLYKYEKGELATDTLCGGTKLLSDADYDLQQLDVLKISNKKYVLFIITMISLLVIAPLIIIFKRSLRKQN